MEEGGSQACEQDMELRSHKQYIFFFLSTNELNYIRVRRVRPFNPVCVLASGAFGREPVITEA